MSQPIPYVVDKDKLDVEALDRFTRQTEKAQPITFAGRRDLLTFTSNLLKDIEEDQFQGNSLFIKGAPGSGKSSLLRHFQECLSDKDTSCVLIEGEFLSEPSLLVGEFVRSFTNKQATDIAESRIRKHSSTADLKLFQQNETWELHQPSTLQMLKEGVDIWQILEQVLNPDSTHTFLLLIDEAQRITTDEGSKVNLLATNLHAGFTGNIRIIPVFAGLSDTPFALAQAGISRTARPFVNLRELSAEESESVVIGFIDASQFGIVNCFNDDDQARIAKSLAAASEGWPRHLHCYLQGLANSLVSDLRREEPLGEIDLDLVLEFGHKARYQYCRDRLDSADLGIYKIAIMDVLEISDGRDIAVQKIQKTAEDKYGISIERAEVYYRRAIHSGVLEESEFGSEVCCRFPIPSFQTFMLCRSDFDRTMYELRRSLDVRLESV